MLDEIDDVFYDLPENPKQALVVINERLKKKIFDLKEDEAEDLCRIANAVIEEWCNQYAVSIDAKKLNGPAAQYGEYIKAMGKLESEVYRDAIGEKISLIKSGNLTQFGHAKLDATEKEQIHKNLNNIRNLVGESVLPDSKKNAIYEKLNKLAAEVDRTGTKTDAFFGLLGDLGIHLGAMAKGAEPLTKEIKSILKIVMRSRARTEDVALPKSEDFPLLESPDENDEN